MDLGRLYQIFGAVCILSVAWYCWRQCAGLPFRRAIPVAVALTFLFIWIHYKSISAPMLTYGAIGLFAIPAILYGLLYRYEVLLISCAMYVPYSSMLPADFGGAQQALNGTNILVAALILGLFISRREEPMALSCRVLKSGTFFLAAFMGLAAIAFLRASLQFGAVYYLQMSTDLKRYLDPMILSLFFMWVIPDRQTAKIIFSVLLIVVIMAFFLGLLEWINLGFGTYSGFKRRIGSLNMQPNVFGAFIAYHVCLFWGLFLVNCRSMSGKLLLLSFLLGIRLLIPTNSRGAWISFPPAYVVSTWFFNPLFCFVVCLIVGMGLVLNPSMLPETVVYRFQEATQLEESEALYAEVPSGVRMFGESQSISMRTRYSIMETGLQVWKANLFFGHGYGTFSFKIREYTGGSVRGTAHNGWLKMLVEMGILALAVLFVLLGFFFFSALQVYRQEKDPLLKGCALGYLGTIPAILVANLTGERFSHIDLLAVFWMMSAVLVKLRAIIEAERVTMMSPLQKIN